MNKTGLAAVLYIVVFIIAYAGFFYLEYASRHTDAKSPPQQQNAIDTTVTIPPRKVPNVNVPDVNAVGNSTSTTRSPVIPVIRPQINVTPKTDVKSPSLQQPGVNTVALPPVKPVGIPSPNSTERLPELPALPELSELPENPESLPTVESLRAAGLGAGNDSGAVQQKSPVPVRPAVESKRNPVRTRKSEVYFPRKPQNDTPD